MAKSQRLILCLIVAVLALFIGTNAIPIVKDVANPIGVNAPSTSTPAPAKPTPTSSKSATASPTQKPSPTPTKSSSSSDSSSDSNTDSNSDSSPTSSPSEDNSAAATTTPSSTGLPGTQLKTSTGPIVAASVVSSLVIVILVGSLIASKRR